MDKVQLCFSVVSRAPQARCFTLQNVSDFPDRFLSTTGSVVDVILGLRDAGKVSDSPELNFWDAAEGFGKTQHLLQETR